LPFAKNGDVRIHYRVVGKGPPLALMHGGGGSSKYFDFMGWTAGLEDRYRLLLIDARGHGLSDKPHEPEAYRRRLMAGDVVKVLDDQGIDEAHYFGYSMGGAIGWGLAKYYPKRVKSLIIGGFWAEDPDPSKIDPEDEKYREILRKGRRANIKAFREQIEQERKTIQKPSVMDPLLPYRLRNASEVDTEAILAFGICLSQERLHMLKLLPRLTTPCLLFAGRKDTFYKGAKKASRLIPNARFVSFPSLGHFETWARLDLALPPVLKFLGDVDRGVAEG
jgi:pimeloyl-ACP methyl ester carboxylesterase